MPAELRMRRVDESGVGAPRRSEAKRDQDRMPVAAALSLHVICIVVAVLAAIIFTLTEHDDHRHTWWCAFEITMQIGLVTIATVYFRKRIELLHDSSVVMPMLVMVVALSLICEPVQRLLFGTGHPLEVLIMHSQCNLMLALAVCGFRPGFQRLSVLIAVFLTIFCCTISNARGLIPLVTLFALAVLVWLVASWWDTVHRRILHSERRRLPVLRLALFVLPVLCLLSVGSFGANTVTHALQGFMPSSGGTGKYDPFSRGGVNDGDALVAGTNNIKSFAAIEEAPFIDSDKPSLFDVVNDTFDTPPKKIKDQQRSVALPAELMLHIHQQMAEAKQAGREFSLIRTEQKADSKRIRDLQTHALFFVAGPTPVHLRMQTYSVFDGITWFPVETREVAHERQMKQVEDTHWLNLTARGRGFELYSGMRTHSLKVSNLDGNIVPTPPHTIGVSIDKMNRVDLYQIGSDDTVALDRKSVPSMTPINLVSECLDRDLLASEDQMLRLHREGDMHAVIPAGVHMREIENLTRSIVSGKTRGWQQVEAVIQHLRQNYVLDRDAKVSEDCVSPVGEFLFRSRSGPEYLFASAAATMLRTLGYSTRLVSGFYAHPEHYDSRLQHTAVYSRDAHFWCEVLLGADLWVTLEPTPGREILGPPPGLMKRLMLLVDRMFSLAADHAGVLAMCFLVSAGAWWQRRFLIDAVLTLHYKIARHRSVRHQALHAARLIDHRLRLANMARRPGTTLRRWASQETLQPLQADLSRVAELADAAAYSMDSAFPNTDSNEFRELTSRLTLRKFQEIQRA